MRELQPLVSSVDEVVRRFHSVLLSNDPLARALTLRFMLNSNVIPTQKEFLQQCLF